MVRLLQDHFVGWFPTNTVCRTAQTFRSSIRRPRSFYQLNDWCFNFTRQLYHITRTNPTNQSADHCRHYLVTLLNQEANGFHLLKVGSRAIK